MPDESENYGSDDMKSEEASDNRPPKKSGLSKKSTIAVMAVVVILLISVPLVYLTMQGGEDDTGDFDDTVVLEISGNDGNEAELTFAELKDLSYLEAVSSYQNRFNNWRGFGTYVGVPLSTLAGLVGGMSQGDVMTVIASDGYSQNLSYSQVVPNEDDEAIQGEIVLAYQFNGTSIPDWDSGPMIAVLAPDGAFSNDDLNATKPYGVEFSGSTSAGSIWVKNVQKIEIRYVLTVNGDTSLTFTIEQLMALPSYSGSGALVKSTGAIVGPNNYTGAPVRDLVEMVYGSDNYSLEVVATDGYTMTFSSSQVINGTFAYYDSTGNVTGVDDFTLLLAYEEEGEPLEDMRLRIVIVDDTESPITDGHFWSKYVRSMNVIQYVQDWTVSISGLTDYVLDRQTFESLATCEWHQTEYIDIDEEAETEDVYLGIPLWILIAIVDGGDDPAGHYEFNISLAVTGYNVTVMASDGYNKTFTSADVAGNDSIIVAYKLNGEYLTIDEGFPLKIEGDISGSMKIKNISDIMLVDLPE
ncbi:MAG TPA: hypothetical protein ENN25_06230 [Euryarchaeota archaeon]|nr:hypothetical protein [Euryarchaeota archaeon]